MKPDPPSWWQDAFWNRRTLLERKLSAGEFYAIAEGEDDDLRFLTDNLQDAAEDFGGWWPPFIIEEHRD